MRRFTAAKYSSTWRFLLPVVFISWIQLLICRSKLGFDVYDIILTLVVPASFSIFASCFGLFINLKHQKFDWKTEAEVVKQSAAAAITVFTGMGISISMGIGFFLILKHGCCVAFAAQMAVSALALVLSYVCWRASLKIKIKGDKLTWTTFIIRFISIIKNRSYKNSGFILPILESVIGAAAQFYVFPYMSACQQCARFYINQNATLSLMLAQCLSMIQAKTQLPRVRA